MVNNISFSGLLFAEPSFTGGMARCLDLGATQTVYNESATEEIADYNALMADWMAVGADMYHAINMLEKELNQDGK
jgi:hypothetical protein